MAQIKKKIKRSASKIKKTAGWAKKELKDRRILDLAATPYSQIKKKIRNTRGQIENLDINSRLALQVGEQILNRAQAVRKSMKLKKPRSNDHE